MSAVSQVPSVEVTERHEATRDALHLLFVNARYEIDALSRPLTTAMIRV
jgi:hypothetical protein